MRPDKVTKVLSLNKVHHHISSCVLTIHFVNRNNVGMPQLHDRLGFIQESFLSLKVIRIAVSQNLDRFDIVGLPMSRPINPGKSSTANQIKNFPFSVQVTTPVAVL